MRLKEERIRLGMSPAEFGTLGGVQSVAQYRYEKGERKADCSYLKNIAARGVYVQYIVTGERSETRLSAEESDLVASFRDLDERVRGVILGLVHGLNPEVKMSTHTTHVSGPTDGIQMNGSFHHQVTINLPESGGKKSSE